MLGWQILDVRMYSTLQKCKWLLRILLVAESSAIPSINIHRSTRCYTTMAQDNTMLKGKYPAKAHCKKVAEALRDKHKDEGPIRIYLQGQVTRIIEDNDEPQPFRLAIALNHALNFPMTFVLISSLGNDVTFSTFQVAPSQTVTSFTVSPLHTSLSSSHLLILLQ